MSFFQGVDDFPVVEPDDAVKAHAVDLKKLCENICLGLVRCVCFHRCLPSLREVSAVGFVAAFGLDFCYGSGMLFDPVYEAAFKFCFVIAVGFGEIDRLGACYLVHDSVVSLVCLALHDSALCVH